MTALQAFVGQARGRAVIEVLERHGIGEMVQPHEWPPRRSPWVADNGAFLAWKRGRPFDGARFMENLDRSAFADMRPRWVVVPDIVADAPATLAAWATWAPRLRPLGLRLAFVVQDGCAEDDARAVLRDGAAGLFVGGTLEWKLATAANWVRVAHSESRWCHIGRVGTGRRVKWAKSIHADSIDSCTPLFSKANLHRFLRAVVADGYQNDLWKPPPPCVTSPIRFPVKFARKRKAP